MITRNKSLLAAGLLAASAHAVSASTCLMYGTVSGSVAADYPVGSIVEIQFDYRPELASADG
jgi:hypothetical protein